MRRMGLRLGLRQAFWIWERPYGFCIEKDTCPQWGAEFAMGEDDCYVIDEHGQSCVLRKANSHLI